MKDMTNEERAAYMRGYRASRRQDVHEACQREIADLKAEIERKTTEIEILERLVKGGK